MWHQFGVIEPDPAKGIFLEIGDIPKDWMDRHYLTVNTSSVYNNNSPFMDDTTGEVTIHSIFNQSLCNLVGFAADETTPGSKKLGKLAQSKTIKEAVVMIPYTMLSDGDPTGPASTVFDNKAFISIPSETYFAAIHEGVDIVGDSIEAAGGSVRRLIQQMSQYVLPPQLDFLNNPAASPIVMYFLEFDYTLDRDDLSYIWQNIAPRNSKKANFETKSTGHYILNTELLNASLITADYTSTDGGATTSWEPARELRWMVFKVKQRARTHYSDLIPRQVAGAAAVGGAPAFAGIPGIGQIPPMTQARAVNIVRENLDGIPTNPGTAPVSPPSFEQQYQHNWPYDYLSFVEMVKIDANIEFNKDLPILATLDDLTSFDDSFTIPPIVEGEDYLNAHGAGRSDTAPVEFIGGAGGSTYAVRTGPIGDFSSLSVGGLGGAVGTPGSPGVVRRSSARLRSTTSATDSGPGSAFDPDRSDSY
jgi:hypothetical protein